MSDINLENESVYDFVIEGRENGLFEGLLLVGANMLIDEYDNVIYNSILNEVYMINKYKKVITEEQRKIKMTKYDKDKHLNNICPIYITNFGR